MKWKWVAMAAGPLLLAACSAGEYLCYTPQPYQEGDGVGEAIGKTMVNLPVWTGEIALYIVALCARAYMGH